MAGGQYALALAVLIAVIATTAIATHLIDCVRCDHRHHVEHEPNLPRIR